MSNKNRGRRLPLDERDRLAEALAVKYERGKTIRQLAAECGRSYGVVRNDLLRVGVVLRSRGGSQGKARRVAGTTKP